MFLFFLVLCKSLSGLDSGWYSGFEFFEKCLEEGLSGFDVGLDRGF